MNNKQTVEVPGMGLQFTTGDMAKFANGAVTVTQGETKVFVSATAATTMRPGQDFFPLTVDYREKYSAAGRFPGGFFKREGRPSEKEILTSRLCDRPCRPLFPDGFLNEVQLIGLLLSADQINESDILMLNGCSAALAISDIPWNGPIGAVRVAEIDGEFVANPTIEQMFSSTLDLIYVGTKTEMLMIEGSADQIPEARFVEAVEFGQAAIQRIIATIEIDLAKARAAGMFFVDCDTDRLARHVFVQWMRGLERWAHGTIDWATHRANAELGLELALAAVLVEPHRTDALRRAGILG